MRKVLLAEDNSDCRDLFSVVIRRLGYQVLEAATGVAAVEKTFNELPDLVLTDISLPRMSGIKATAWIKNNPVTCHIPVVICSAFQGEEIVNEGLRVGAAQVLIKPISPDSLREVLHSYLPSANDQEHRQAS